MVKFDNQYIVANNSLKYIVGGLEPPKYSLWITEEFVLSLHKQPNWFHRQMQKLFFGFKWEKK